MAGSKRTKAKGPRRAATPPPPPEMALDDDELMNDLMAQLDSRDEAVQAESASVLNEMQLNKQADQIEAQRQDAKSRFRARQARKAATLAQSLSPVDPEVQATLEKEARDEEEAIAHVCKEQNLLIHQINPDGHCLFSAIADQLVLLGLIPPSQATYINVRAVAANYIYSHPDDFIPFLPSTGGEDGAGALDPGLMTPAQFEQYCLSIRNTAEWGGEPEILALSRAFNVPIHIIQGDVPSVVIHNPEGGSMDRSSSLKEVIKISYHRKLYGLGEHYNSLRPVNYQQAS